MRQKQKGFIPIIILVAIIVLAGVGGTAYYAYSSRQPKEAPVPPQQENQYTGWQEYVNPQYNYTIKYPPDWFFNKTGYNPPPPATIELSNVDEKSGFTGEALLLEVSSLPAPGESLETNGEIQSLSSQGYSKKTITISGEPGVKLEKEDQEGGVNTSIYVYHQGNVYRVVWNLWNTEIRRLNEGLLQKITDSFVFTD